MKLSVIMPTYNEGKTILQIIEKVQRVPINKEICIVNDGSTDNTRELLKKCAKSHNIKVVHHERNKGKGAAIQTGRKYISGDIVIIQDADLETDPLDYLHLVNPIIKGETKVVYGSRFLNNKISKAWKYYYGATLITYIANLLYGQKLTDEPTCYKVFDTDFFKSINLECNGFDFCPEITAKISNKGVKIVELPMKYFPRTKEEGKKVKVKDGIIAIWTLVKYKIIA